MPISGHLVLWPGLLHMIPLLNLCSGHTWNASCPNIEPVGLAWRCQWSSALVPPLGGHESTYAQDVP